MANTPTSKTHHARSISLPSRPHPLISRCNELLGRFNACETVSSSTISNQLIMLKDLHDCVDDLLQLPENQQILSHESHEKFVDGLLDGSLRLLDICGSAKDALSQNKEFRHELQSSLRRRSGGETGFAKEAALYLTQRRSIKKAAGHLKDMENLSTDHDNLSIGSVLRQAQIVTGAALESILAFIAGKKAKSNNGKWTLVLKIMQSKRISIQKQETSGNEFEMVDAALKSLMDHNTNKSMQIQNVQILFEELESTTEDLEQGVECLFRQLIKTRVSLLNKINH